MNYASARLLQCAMAGSSEFNRGGSYCNTGYGVSNATRIMDISNTPHDGGIILIDVESFKLQAFGGCWEVSENGDLELK